MIPFYIVATLLLGVSNVDSDKYAKKQIIDPDLIVSLKDSELNLNKSKNNIKIRTKEPFVDDDKVLQESVQNQNKYHIVKVNENLTMISYLYGIPLKKIIALNNIKDPNFIQIGRKILLV